MYNLKYANPDATEEDVYDACRAAAIHDRIMSSDGTGRHPGPWRRATERPGSPPSKGMLQVLSNSMSCGKEDH